MAHKKAGGFLPVPLFNIPAIANGDYKTLIKWQEDWQACDQIQINGATRCHRYAK